MKKAKQSGSAKTDLVTQSSVQASFVEVVDLIRQARQRAFQAVNTELIDLYWRVGEYISRKLEKAAWGEGVVEQLAEYIVKQHPDLKGFTRPNLFRMRQFHETYRHDEKVSPLLRQLSWTHNLMILSRCKRPEEREFYLRLAIQERWSSRELERQLGGALFERTVLSPPKVSAVLTQLHPLAATVFKDTYLLDFLDLPEVHSEQDLLRPQPHTLAGPRRRVPDALPGQATAPGQAPRVLRPRRRARGVKICRGGRPNGRSS
jgi:predicted nuclease of restriction endonuclease-like (RecB) superfamily